MVKVQQGPTLCRRPFGPLYPVQAWDRLPPFLLCGWQNAVIRLGMRRDMTAPVWEGVTLIPDEITKAGSGQIVVTAVMLYSVKILRAAGLALRAVLWDH